MNTIQNLFQQAQLAEAAYANFIDPLTGLSYSTNKGIEDALKDKGNSMSFSQSQAAAFAARYQVVSQQPNTASGFSATLFLDTTTGEYVFAARGTEPTAIFTDWATNLGDVGSDVFGQVRCEAVNDAESRMAA